MKTAVSKLSVSQRQLLSIEKDDIFYAFPYQVGVLNNNDKNWTLKVVGLIAIYEGVWTQLHEIRYSFFWLYFGVYAFILVIEVKCSLCLSWRIKVSSMPNSIEIGTTV